MGPIGWLARRVLAVLQAHEGQGEEGQEGAGQGKEGCRTGSRGRSTRR